MTEQKTAWFNLGECFNYVADYFDKNEFGSLAFIVGGFLNKTGLLESLCIDQNEEGKVKYGAKKTMTLFTKRRVTQLMNELQRSGYVDKFSNSSWKRIRRINRKQFVTYLR